MKNGIIFFGYEKRQDSDMSWLTLEGNEKFLVAQVVWECSQYTSVNGINLADGLARIEAFSEAEPYTWADYRKK